MKNKKAQIFNIIFTIFIAVMVMIIATFVWSNMNQQIQTINSSNVAGNLTTSFINDITDLSAFFPVMMALIIALATISIIVKTISSFGSEEEETTQQIEEEPKVLIPHKQTYFEYVKERLAVENLFKRK